MQGASEPAGCQILQTGIRQAEITKRTAPSEQSFFVFEGEERCDQHPSFSASFRPMSTPMTDAIIRPRVQPEESPRQCRP